MATSSPLPLDEHRRYVPPVAANRSTGRLRASTSEGCSDLSGSVALSGRVGVSRSREVNLDGSRHQGNVRRNEPCGSPGRRPVAQYEAQRGARHGHRFHSVGVVSGTGPHVRRRWTRFLTGHDFQSGRVRGPASQPSAELSLLHAREFLQAGECSEAEHLHSVGQHEQLPGVLRLVRAADSRNVAASICRFWGSARTVTWRSTSPAVR